MSSVSIDDFRDGLDVRKSALTAPGGSLQLLENCVVTEGGELEKRKAFVEVAELAPGSFGLFGQGGNLHVFGTVAPGTLGTLPSFAAVGVGTGLGSPPVQVIYHQVAHASPMTELVSNETYKAKFQITAKHADGLFHSFWDGAEVIGPAGGYGWFEKSYGSKIYSTNGRILQFTTIGDPSQYLNTAPSPGGGFIDLSEHDRDGEALGGIEVYYENLAVFARHLTQLWHVDPDPTLNALKQTVRIGTTAPRSVTAFGTGDVLFLSDSGVRSLRASNTSQAAAVIDVGSPVDRLTQAAALADEVAAYKSRAVLQPITGRYWLSIGSTVYVLSFFPSGKITAWSTFTLAFVVDDWGRVGNRVFARSGNKIYLYGGLDDLTYDTSVARVRTPHMGLEKPTVMKKASALASINSGTWQIALGMVADNTTIYELVATIVGPSIAQHRIPVVGHGTHVSIEAVSSDPTAALLSSVALTYTEAERL